MLKCATCAEEKSPEEGQGLLLHGGIMLQNAKLQEILVLMLMQIPPPSKICTGTNLLESY